MTEQPRLRPIPCPLTRPGARRLAGGWLGFAEIEVLQAGHPAEILPAAAAAHIHDPHLLDRLDSPAPVRCGLSLERPRLMVVVNVTPDSFSDGGRLAGPEAAVDHALQLAEDGADILDIGGESTRPGAIPVSIEEECARVLPVIEGIVAAGCAVPISIDTRNAATARAAIAAGARLFNDVSALTHDPDSASVAAEAYCLMHAQGTPETMQTNPRYENALLDVFAALEARITASGLPRDRLIADPGIGFGKTVAHNLALIRRLSLFHALGVPVLLGVSRKGFIGKLTGEAVADRRAPGSIAAALWGVAQGAQILRVHDVAETRQALTIWQEVEDEHEPQTLRH
ncbi:MAG: dihydropteroate synthase [Pseudomonadota bacterium]